MPFSSLTNEDGSRPSNLKEGKELLMEHKKKSYLVTVISIDKETESILLYAGFYPVGAGGKLPPPNFPAFPNLQASPPPPPPPPPPNVAACGGLEKKIKLICAPCNLVI